MEEMSDLPVNTPWEAGSDQENAWISEVLGQHGKRALILALRIVGQVRDAEDVLQESLLKLVRRVRKEPVENPGGYLNAVIKTTALDVLAKRKSERLSCSEVDDCPSQEHTDPSGPIQSQELSVKLGQAIRQLNPRLAKIVIGRNLRQQSYTELAQKMGVSCNTARIYHWMALKKLREFSFWD